MRITAKPVVGRACRMGWLRIVACGSGGRTRRTASYHGAIGVEDLRKRRVW